MDWGEPLIKATYFLEGDGPLALECYEAVKKVSEAVHVAHTLNVLATAQQLSGAPLTDPCTVSTVGGICKELCYETV